MKLLETIDESVSHAIDSGGGYIQLTEKYYKLKIFQQLALLSAWFYKAAIFGTFLCLGLIFMAIALSAVLGNLLGSAALGYLCVGGLFFILLALVYVARRMIDGKIIQNLAKTFFD